MSENYQVLARKYRPQSFADVVGQRATVTILKNAIRLKRTAQAYLFSGSRGIGKTTLARLLAKALNCQQLSEDIEPCNRCASCLEIAGSCSLDVIEIDGASNRGIDDIRQINETIGYAPSSGKFKIYIIDEVHMLTKEAFNALLKTLEEPPPSIKFFFATTEPHKIPPTILSRCQRFDLSRIANLEIIAKLKKILAELNREAEDKALHLIASFADGSLRDSQSLLDQLLCYENGPLTENAVSKILGIIPEEYFFHLDEAVKAGREAFAFELAEQIHSSGKDFTHFTEDLLEHFRRYLVLKYQPESLELSLESQKIYQKNEPDYTAEELAYLLETILQILPVLQKSLSKKTTIEMLLLQIIRLKKRIFLPQLVQRLIELEKALETKNLPEETALPPLSADLEKPQKPAAGAENISKNAVTETAAEPAAPSSPSLSAASNFSSALSGLSEKTSEGPNNPLCQISSQSQKATLKENLPKAEIPPEPENGPVLKKTPFSLNNPKTENQTSSQKEAGPGHLDTLIHFAAVEFNGIAKKQ
ncbi:MAG: DNA polymerase III subunit gamma/tau [Parachlamydiales bacterium]|jgi:DNA polymerase-3 subunit gamma/tau